MEPMTGTSKKVLTGMRSDIMFIMDASFPTFHFQFLITVCVWAYLTETRI